MLSLTSLGGAGTVTGSKHLITYGKYPHPDRLRTFQGIEKPARAELAASCR